MVNKLTMPEVGKAHTQKIESKHLNLRTRIKRFVRRTICFSKTERLHNLVIGLFSNRYEFGRPVSHGINTFATSSDEVTRSPPHPPTWMMGRRSGFSSACRTTSCVTGAVSPSPNTT
jgi:hypothetical protein